MKINLRLAAGLAGLLLSGCAGFQTGDGVFIMGDTAYIDGHAVSKARYKAAVAKGTLPQLRAQLAQQAAIPPQQKIQATATAQPVPAAGENGASGMHAAICDTFDVYDAYPGDSALFSCTAGLGSRTRTQLLAAGWKINLMEKIPVGDDRTSARGLPLFAYKLVLSR